MKALELAKLLLDYPNLEVKLNNENGDDIICITSKQNRHHEPVVILDGPNDDIFGIISDIEDKYQSGDYNSIDEIIDYMLKLKLPYYVCEYTRLNRTILDAYFKAIILQRKFNLLIKDYDIDNPREYFRDGRFLPRERYVRMICDLNVNINVVYNAFLALRIHPDDIIYFNFNYKRDDFNLKEYADKYHHACTGE